MLSFLVLLKSTIYLVFYYSRNSTVTGIVEHLIPRMEVTGRLPRYMGVGHCTALSGCPIPSISYSSPHGWVLPSLLGSPVPLSFQAVLLFSTIAFLLAVPTQK